MFSLPSMKLSLPTIPGPGRLASVAAVLGLMLGLALPLRAQWQSETITLRGGWNAIYLHGDADHATLDELFPNSGPTAAITEVWRWNPNPDQIQFTTSPLLPTQGTPEWSTWRRGNSLNTLERLTGQHAYLVRCTGAAGTTFTITLPQRPLPPSSTWVRNGANLLGFPSARSGSPPFFSQYFATFPVAIAANARIFQYVGGELSGSNPMQIFSPGAVRVDRNQAYWFEAAVVGNFYAPVQITLSRAEGLDFGRTGSVILARVLNRTAQPMTVTIAPVLSNSPPAGQEAIAGPVPLTRRTFSSETASWQEVRIMTSYTEIIPPNSAVELSFGLDRTAMTGDTDFLYASLLRFTDAGNLFDILIPAQARKSSLAGLWLGEALVTAVESKAQQDEVTPVGRSFPLRTLLHVDDDGVARLLSQVHLGPLATPPHELGLTVYESALRETSLADAARITVAHLPLDLVADGSDGSGTVAIPGTLTRLVTVAHDDPTNPFVHQYHPDHDNLDGQGNALPSGFESYSVERRITFTFTPTPPPGSTVTAGWGSTVIGGTYTEVIQGLHKDSAGVDTGDGLHLSGTFELRRISELNSLVLNP